MTLPPHTGSRIIYPGAREHPHLVTWDVRVYDGQTRAKMNDPFQLSKHVKDALDHRVPILALESTVISHGLPYPLNLETALACEDAIRRLGVTPATLGIVNGIPTIGLSDGEIRQFATGRSPNGDPIEKVSINNLAGAIIRRSWGATTVASSLRLAHAADIRVFTTGGIGGVHRGAVESFDISADLSALADTPVICVCAGAKAILDLPKTIEYLETFGVPVIGYCTDEFPAFYSRSSGLAVDVAVDNQDDAARVAERHWQLGARTGVLVCVPVPAEFEIENEVIDAALDAAMATAAENRIRGKAVTPFLLAELERLTGGTTVQTNRALLTNNAAVAAEIAASFARLKA
jgi:pseudouridylate synthase